jgi:glycerol-3-phosphate O-acyltransferase
MSKAAIKVDALHKEGTIPLKLKNLILDLEKSYRKSHSFSSSPEKGEEIFEKLIDLVAATCKHPPHFDIFHKCIRQPFDYYQFGLDFMRPFVDSANSKIEGIDEIHRIRKQLDNGENVILFSNHQTEADPQIISLLLEDTDPQLASEMIFVAGHRVVSDPMAIPMSLGRNLLCIYSKKHMQYPPEDKAEKILHNRKTLKKMQELLNQGGVCIYVAPSGGRDRQDALGNVDVAPFDIQSTELFWLLGKKTTVSTHFFPLALKTYPILPPPALVEKELGEKRIIQRSPAYLSFGQEINMEHFPGSNSLDKKTKRGKRADYIYHLVHQAYLAFPSPI